MFKVDRSDPNFTSSLSVLVNGSLTEEINIRRGLKQGDLLAPFPFLIVSEGPAGLVQTIVRRNRFAAFSLGSPQMEISYLLHADDTLLIGEATVANL